MTSDKALHGKFVVTRTDGSSENGGKHEWCSYFVLDLGCDPAAIPAIRAFCDAAREGRPRLVASIEREILSLVADEARARATDRRTT